MQFLYPSFFIALVGLAIPIIIHILNLQRSKKLTYSNIAFIKETFKESSRINTVKRYLILFSRLFFLAFLVLAFTQPILLKEKQADVSRDRTVAIIWDKTLSNTAKYNDISNLEKGSAVIDKLISSFSEDQTFLYYDNSDRNQAIQRLKTIQLRERLAEAVPSEAALTVQDQLMAVNAYLSTNMDSLSGSDIFLVSDMQKNSEEDIELSSNVQLNVLQLSAPDGQNVFIDSIWIDKPFLGTGENIALQVSLRNIGAKAVKDVNLSLEVGEQLVSKSAVDIQGDSRSIETINFKVQTRGQHRARLRIDDEPFSFDNGFLFNINIRKEIAIAIISDSISHTFAALKNEESFFSTVMSTKEVSYERIEASDFVIVENYNSISSGLESSLEKVLQNGGSVLFFPNGDDEIPALFSSFYSEPLKVEEQTEIYLSKSGTNLFEDVFNGEVSNYSRPTAQLKYDLQNLEPIFFVNDFTALGAQKVGNGRVICAAFGLEEKVSNFKKHALFVPFLYKTAYQTARINQLYYRKAKDLIIPDVYSETVLELVGEAYSYIPDQSTIPSGYVISIPNKLIPGYYHLLNGADTVYSFSLNDSKLESQTEFYEEEEIGNSFKGNVEVLDVTDLNAIGSSVQNLSSDHTALWKYCIILSLVFLLLEIVVIRLVK